MPVNFRPIIVLLAILFAGVAPARSLFGQLAVPGNILNATTHWSEQTARPGDHRVLAIVVDIADRFHINPNADQLSPDFAFLIPTTIEPRIVSESPPPPLAPPSAHPSAPSPPPPSDPALRFGPIQFPQPHDITVNYTGDPDPANQKILPAYEKRTVFYLPVVIPPTAAPGNVELALDLRYQACDDTICFPPKTIRITTTLSVLAADAPSTSPSSTPADSDLFADFDATVFATLVDLETGNTSNAGKLVSQPPVHFDLFGLAFDIDADRTLGFVALLFVAALGGFLLNFTPCVLPVIPIKIMSLSRAAGSRGRCLALGLAMTAGIVGFWLAIGAAIAWISGFSAINELFRRSGFTIGVGLVIAVMAIGMCGLFAIRLPQFVYRFSPKQESALGSFLFGIMTAILSTPCTAPFMGAAAAWAITQNPSTTLITFATIGAGMALPYLVLAAFPQLVDRMPRTGPASELIKQVMGLLMLGAAAYFLGVGISALFVDALHPTPNPFYWYVVGLCIIAAGGWLFLRTLTIAKTRGQRGAWGAVGLVIIMTGVSLATSMTRKPPVEWVIYSESALQQAFDDDRIVVLDFTADWCLNCKTLEHTVLYSDMVLDQLNEADVVPMKIDITSTKNQAGYQKLAEVGRVAIPLLIVYAPDGRVLLESDFYTADQVTTAIEAARKK